MEGRYGGTWHREPDLFKDNNRCTCGILQDGATFTLCPVHVYGNVPVEDEIGVSGFGRPFHNTDRTNWTRDFAFPWEIMSGQHRSYRFNSRPWYNVCRDAGTQLSFGWARDFMGQRNWFPRRTVWEMWPFGRDGGLYDLWQGGQWYGFDRRAPLGHRLSDFWW
jgi:hypothetical protein